MLHTVGNTPRSSTILGFHSRRIVNTPQYFDSDELPKPPMCPFTGTLIAGIACVIVSDPRNNGHSCWPLFYALFGLDRQCSDVSQEHMLVHLVRLKPVSDHHTNQKKFKTQPREDVTCDTIIHTFRNAIDSLRTSRVCLNSMSRASN